MKRSLTIPALLFAVAVLGSAPPRATAVDLAAVVELLRPSYQADREGLVREALMLTPSEADAFWPLYRKYRAEMEPLGDELVNLLLEYRDLYPAVPDARVSELLRRLTELEVKLARTRGAHLKRAGKALPPGKALRWAQIENRLDLALRLQIAGIVPLAPGTDTPP